jgi:hypothetical protein
MRYSADITAGALKISESRVIADLLLRGIGDQQWKQYVVKENVLQARNSATAVRLTRLIRSRLELMDSDLWGLVRDGNHTVATHACLAAAVKQSALFGDFLDLVVREQYRTFSPMLSKQLWEGYLEGCRSRDPDTPLWNESTRNRLRSSVFQMLAQSGYIEDTKTLKLQSVQIAPEVIRYLQNRNESYTLRCIQLST